MKKTINSLLSLLLWKNQFGHYCHKLVSGVFVWSQHSNKQGLFPIFSLLALIRWGNWEQAELLKLHDLLKESGDILVVFLVSSLMAQASYWTSTLKPIKPLYNIRTLCVSLSGTWQWATRCPSTSTSCPTSSKATWCVMQPLTEPPPSWRAWRRGWRPKTTSPWSALPSPPTGCSTSRSDTLL